MLKKIERKGLRRLLNVNGLTPQHLELEGKIANLEKDSEIEGNISGTICNPYYKIKLKRPLTDKQIRLLLERYNLKPQRIFEEDPNSMGHLYTQADYLGYPSFRIIFQQPLIQDKIEGMLKD